MFVTLAVLAVSAVFFVSGKVRSDLVALCALVALLLCHVLTPEEALSGFSNSVVIMMVGLFVVGGAIFQTGLAKMISSYILRFAGKSESRLFLLVILVTSAIGAFVSNTGTVALMLPIVVSLAVSAGINPGRLLMPLAFASSMGGMMTLIGTPPNLVIQEALVSAGYEPLSFFSFLPVGMVCVAVGIVVLMPLSRLFLSRHREKKDKMNPGKSLKQLVSEYGLSDNLLSLQVNGKSGLFGATVMDLWEIWSGRGYGDGFGHSSQVWAEYTGSAAGRFFQTSLPEDDNSADGRPRHCISAGRYPVCYGGFQSGEGTCERLFVGLVGRTCYGRDFGKCQGFGLL